MTCEQIEIYLSGYLDAELTQQDMQKVGVHLENCAKCRRILEDLEEARGVARELELQRPTSEEWKDMERHIFENLSRGIGWLILIVWSTMTVVYGLFQFAVSPGEPLFHKILVFGLFLGISLLFFSVLMQRVRESRTDRYKGVLR